MNDADFIGFVAAYDGVSRLLRGDKITTEGFEIAFAVLRKYSLEQFKAALETHVEKCKWVPAPSELIEVINPPKPELSNADLIGLARAGDTPLGVLARYKIGSYNLNHWSDRALQAHVATVRMEIDRVIDNAAQGQLDTDMGRILEKHGFNRFTELIPGLPCQTVPQLEVVG